MESTTTQTEQPSPDSSIGESRPPSDASSSGITSGYQYPPQGDWFRSRRIKKEEVQKPWLDRKDPKEKWVTIIPLVGLFLGFCIVGVLVWDGYRSVVQHSYCEVLNDDFTSWNSKVWTKEVEVGGYGYVVRRSVYSMAINCMIVTVSSR
jgi:hypothetical protein